MRKLIVGALIGAAGAAGITSAIFNKKINNIQAQREKENEVHAEVVSKYETEIKHIMEDRDEKIAEKDMFIKNQQAVTNLFYRFSDPNLVADLSRMNTDDMDECLTAVKKTRDTASTVLQSETASTSDLTEYVDKLKDATEKYVSSIIDLYDGYDDEDDDENMDLGTISPKRVVIGCITDPDRPKIINLSGEEIQLLPGSNPADNEYSFLLDDTKMPELYKFIGNALLNQLRSHKGYIERDLQLSDLQISVTLGYISDDDVETMELISASAAVGFQIFSEEKNGESIIYTGGMLNDILADDDSDSDDDEEDDDEDPDDDSFETEDEDAEMEIGED